MELIGIHEKISRTYHMKNLRRKLLKRFEYKVIKNKPASVNLTPE